MTDTNTETLSSDAGGGQIVKKKGKIPFAVKIAGGVLALVFGGVWALTPSSTDVQPVVSTVGSGTQVNSTPGGEIQRTNEDYARQIELQNDINAKKAEDSGESFIPFLEKPLEPITTTEENIKVEDETPVDTAPKRVVSTEVRTNEAPIPVVKRTPVETQQQAQQQQQENPYLKNMISTFGAITDGMKPTKSASEELDSNRLADSGTGSSEGMASGQVSNGQPVVNHGQNVQGQAGIVRRDGTGQTQSVAAQQYGNAAVESGNVPPEMQSGQILIKSGDILYARVLGGVTSDNEAPVIIEILSGGENYKARLVGSYGVDDTSGKMVVNFRQMTWPDGTARSVQALAVDENTGDMAVRSGIQRRYMARYAPIFASKFIAGLASAAGEGDTSIVDSGSGQYAIMSKKTMEESAWTGLGDAMSAISDDIAARSPKGPKIILGNGATLGVMFVQDLREDDK